jgi:hypothetical protein
MGTRLHVFIAVCVISLTSSGCFLFGGGGDKKQPTASRQAKLDQQQHEALAGRDDTVSKMLKPRDSAVQWPDPNELRLSDTPLPKSERVVRREDPAPPPPVARALKTSAPPTEVIQPSEAVEPAPPVEPHEAVAAVGAEDSSQGAVANKGLELTAPEQPVAVAAAGKVAQTPGVAPQRKAAAGHLDEAAGRITQRLRDNPTELSAHLDYQLQRFLADEAAPDLDALAPLPAEDRELITALLDGLTNFRNGLRSDSNMLFSKKVRPLLEMVARLRNQAELSIPTIALCRGVTTFGNYEPMDGRFVAGAKNETIVYCEVENVSSQQNADGVWESKLSQEAVLYTEDGQKVWSNPAQITPDFSRNRRRDFFLAQKITLPANLTIDRYILKFAVEDKQVGRIAEATVPVQIVASLGPQQLPAIPLTGNKDSAVPGRGQPIARDRSGQTDAARQAGERQTAPRADLPREPIEGK